MRKLVLAIAVFATMGSFAFTQSNPQAEKTSLVAEAIQNDYKEVHMSELNQNVRDAIKAFEGTHHVKKLEYDAAMKRTRVTLEDKMSKTKKTVILNDDGKEI